MTTIPASPGYFVVSHLMGDNGQPYDIFREPIIAWCCQPGCAPLPVTLSGPRNDYAISRPDGSVQFEHCQFENIPAWSRQKYPKAKIEHRCEYRPVAAMAGSYILEGYLDDENTPLLYETSKTPIIAWAVGDDGEIRPVSQVGVHWDYPYVLNADGTVARFEQTWKSVEEWCAYQLNLELCAQKRRAAGVRA